MEQEVSLTRVNRLKHSTGCEAKISSKKEDMEFAECNVDIIKNKSPLEFVTNLVFSSPVKEGHSTKSYDRNTISSSQKYHYC
jgi:hypothetical protein